MQDMSASLGEVGFNCSATRQKMSQTSGREDNQSINNCPWTDMDRMAGMKVEEETGTTGSGVECLIFMPLALTLTLFRRGSGVEAADEVINLLNNINFNLALFREMVKRHRECEEISQYVIDQCKEEWKSQKGVIIIKPDAGTV